ncbi:MULTISPECIES: LysR family transcriptional regulator [unclassified Sphingomonas]|uniref:LysR family transcriptional regulator n=1 Tax=unclassified Sphingomonas TaxID=196159 RepID=UPI000E71ECC7|nr:MULTISPECIES: LysR family transcriptional regulator [unclassified Sphingomonas]RKE42747.1 LysR family transcriptional regulator [Sphingomonas sp. PP-CC-1A-547]TCM05529.1 LysR family transcriptional regulator [Sphingomonas sp. PP-CC-3G-468]
MPTSRSDLADLTYFLAISRHRSFRLAGLELGVSASALSHALKGLEARLGVRLLHRTNRSVTLTAAGEELRDKVAEPFGTIDQAIEGLNRYRDAPTGRVRLNVAAEAAPLLLAPIMPVFIERYPDIEIDIAASDQMTDVIDDGFDAGIRYGGTVPEDMVAQRLSGELRWVVVASPAYLEKFGIPQHPSDLEHHHCLGVRLGNAHIYRWEFEGPEGEFSVPVPSKILVNGGRAMLAMALAGTGLMYGMEASFAPHLARGELRLVLEDWATMGPGYHVYYSSRRQLPTGLRLLIELIREMRPLGL